MSTPDLIAILDRLGQNLFPVQALLTGFGYLLGVVFIIISIHKFYTIGNARARSSASEHMLAPMSYLIGGALLILVPSTFKVMRNTLFGVGSPLAYAPYDPYDFNSAITVVIQTVGVLWFIRGTALLVQSSSPGVQHGAKGMVFLFAGILCMNFDETTVAINSALSWITQATLTTQKGLGY